MQPPQQQSTLSAALCKNTAPISLNLQRSNLGSEGGKALITAKPGNRGALAKTQPDFFEFSKKDALCKNTAPISLNLQRSNFGSEGGKALANALYKNAILTSLNLILGTLI
ncbi:hypothetical protein C2G38_2236397 [Gigaspora rosea]|uniref:Uncharacterized protein n=1 Tax=Gigaspora rosea TaxID=44941 RepID=A0A397TP37_9GLOM|nr:hypothetical protein C2G38_2236397 [Gigaspora rosea]